MKRMKVTDQLRDRMKAMYATGKTQKEIAEVMGCNHQTVMRAVKHKTKKPKSAKVVKSTPINYTDVVTQSSNGKMMVIIATADQIKQMVRETW